jgi:hypothetical protein
MAARQLRPATSAGAFEWAYASPIPMHRTISPILETWCRNWPGRPLLEKLLQNQRPPRPTSPKNAAFSGWPISLRREASPAFGGTSRGSLPGRPDKLFQNLRPLFRPLFPRQSVVRPSSIPAKPPLSTTTSTARNAPFPRVITPATAGHTPPMTCEVASEPTSSHTGNRPAEIGCSALQP